MFLRRFLANKVANTWMFSSTALILLFPFVIGIALFYKASPILSSRGLSELLFSSKWLPASELFGFLPFVYSSLYVTILAILFSVPLCLFSAIYITEYAHKRLVLFIQPVIDILAGIPSVVYGMWGILVIVPFVGDKLAPLFGLNSSGYSILSGGIVLAVMSIPYMLSMLIETFRTVPKGLREASLSMGATRWETIKHSVLRKSRPGIISAFGLGLAKAFGETLAVMMVVGNVIKISGNPFDAGYPLPALIANNYGEMLSIPMYDSALMFAAFLLLIIILFINLFFRYFIYKTQK